jgi:hypothetical protein
VLYLLLTVALAADPVAGARAALESHPTGAASVVCSRYQVVAPAFATLLGAGGPATTIGAAFGAHADAAARGVDVGAPVTVVFEKGPLAARIGYTGTPEQADAFVHALDAEATGSGGHWTTKDGTTVDLRDGTLEFARPPAGQPAGSRRFAAHDLPSVEGCTFVIDARNKNRPMQAVAVVPHVGAGPSSAYIDFVKPLPPALTRTDAELPVGMLDGPPELVLTISAPLDELLAALPKEAPSPMPGLDLASVRAYASFPAGVTLVSRGNPKTDGQWALMTRVVGTDGDPLPRGRVVKALVKGMADKDAERVNGSTMSFSQKGKATYIAVAKDGAVLVTSSLDLTETAFGDEGTPWLTADDEARARTASVAMRVERKGETVFWLTSQGVDRALEVRSQLTLDPTERAGLAAMGAMMAPMMQIAVQAQAAKVKAAMDAVPEAPAP